MWQLRQILSNYLHTVFILFVRQTFSGFSFGARDSILCWMLCASRPNTANSLTYPFRQRATGLHELMDVTDHIEFQMQRQMEKATEVGRNHQLLDFFLLTFG